MNPGLPLAFGGLKFRCEGVNNIDESGFHFFYLQVVPWGFRKAINWIRREYGEVVIYVTENGFSDSGGLTDQGRINYHQVINVKK